MKLTRGYFAASKLIREFSPDVMLFTGGYVGFPVVLAGKSCPSVLFIPDIEPGMALNALAGRADRLAVVCEDSRAYFPSAKQVEVTGYPIRKSLVPLEKKTAREKFGLTEDLPVLFVFGGSKGAVSINHALMKNLISLLRRFQVIHISGTYGWKEIDENQKTLAPELTARYFAAPYLHDEMNAAFSAADLVISRAGASTLGEFPAFGLPAILVPYPYAWRYQKVNAEYLCSHGAAIMIEDQNLSEQMDSAVTDILANKKKLQSMGEKMAALTVPDAAAHIYRLLEQSARKERWN